MTAAWSVRRHQSADAFLTRAATWLLESEAEHNLLLGLTAQLREDDHGFETPIYLATVESAERVEGCAFRTPPFKLGVTRVPLEAVPALVEDVADVFTSLPAVLGPPDVAERFAALWSERSGVGFRLKMRQRIFSLERLKTPARVAPGMLRVAGSADLPLVVRWAEAFEREAGVFSGKVEALITRLVSRGAVYLWRHDDICCMAAAMAPTPNGVRIGFVYTPSELRGRGYATACTAATTKRLLDEGRRFCFLYTDLDNPTSNAIYERLGYRAVCDVVDYDLT